MSLKKVGIYNDIPEELMPKMPADGTVVTFKSLDSIYDAIEGKYNFPDTTTIPVQSAFKNPNNGASIKIALVMEVDKDGQILRRLKKVWHPRRSQGKLAVTIGVSEEEDMLYQYLMLASFVGSNSNRFEIERPILVLEDLKADAAKQRKERVARKQAMDAAEAIQTAELREKCLILGVNPDADEEMMRNDIEQMAETDPEGFLSKLNDGDGKLIAVIREALRTGVVTREGRSLKWTNGNAPLFELSQDSDIVVPSEFISFIKNEKSGEKIVEMLQKESGKAARKKQ